MITYSLYILDNIGLCVIWPIEGGQSCQCVNFFHTFSRCSWHGIYNWVGACIPTGIVPELHRYRWAYRTVHDNELIC